MQLSRIQHKKTQNNFEISSKQFNRKQYLILRNSYTLKTERKKQFLQLDTSTISCILHPRTTKQSPPSLKIQLAQKRNRRPSLKQHTKSKTPCKKRSLFHKSSPNTTFNQCSKRKKTAGILLTSQPPNLQKNINFSKQISPVRH